MQRRESLDADQGVDQVASGPFDAVNGNHERDPLPLQCRGNVEEQRFEVKFDVAGCGLVGAAELRAQPPSVPKQSGLCVGAWGDLDHEPSGISGARHERLQHGSGNSLARSVNGHAPVSQANQA